MARVTEPFADQLDAWRAYAATPWGRIRYAVVEETLRREMARLGAGLRILDVGGGDGRDAIPLARRGHRVTILDRSRAWLDEARRRAEAAGTQVETVVGDLDDRPALGEYDVVLCHLVLQYRPADADDVPRLAAWTRSGGVVSVLLPNPDGLVLRRLVVAGAGAALEELHADTARTVLFDDDVRKIPAAEAEDALRRSGLPVVRRYGTRIANDLLATDDAKHDGDGFADLLRLELALCDREPFVRVGGMYQLIASRP